MSSAKSLYVIVEGERTEPALCRAWLPILRPGIQRIDRIEDAQPNTYYLITGNGYPSYFDRIKNAKLDIETYPGLFHFVVWVDAEEMSPEARLAEVNRAIAGFPCETTIIIANCCVETWLLGNRAMVNRQASEMKPYLHFFDIYQHDPELCPKKDGHSTKAETHLDYLKTLIHTRREVGHEGETRRLRYGKANPGPVLHPTYFEALCRRVEEGHLQSMRTLLDLRAAALAANP